MRIVKTQYYLCSKIARNCLGYDFNAPQLQYIVTGHKAQGSDRVNVVDVFNPAFMTTNPVTYILRDGHCLESCPQTESVRRAIDFLDINKFATVEFASMS